MYLLRFIFVDTAFLLCGADISACTSPSTHLPSDTFVFTSTSYILQRDLSSVVILADISYKHHQSKQVVIKIPAGTEIFLLSTYFYLITLDLYLNIFAISIFHNVTCYHKICHKTLFDIQANKHVTNQ